MSLRRKKPAEDVFKELGESSKDSGGKRRESRPPRKDSRRGSRREHSDRRGSRDRRSRESRERRPPTSRREMKIEEPAKSSEESTLLEKLSTIKNEALLLDKEFKEIKKVDLESLKKEKDLKKANALVIDDIITNDVLKLADKCKYIVGITTAGNLSTPSDKVIVTKF
jgi:hypothetical protein